MSKPIIISNSTPIILLQKIGKLDLLKKLYGMIYIPEAVYQEVIIDGVDKIDNHNFIKQAKWIEVISINDVNAKKMFITSLHEGEVETMILALEMRANLCIIDDLLARKYAKGFGLNITGTLGILIEGKNKCYISKVKPLLDELVSNGMYINYDLYTVVLSKANE